MLILSIFRNSIKEHYHAWSALLLQGFNIQDLWNHVHLYKEKVMQTSTGALKTMFWVGYFSCFDAKIITYWYG